MSNSGESQILDGEETTLFFTYANVAYEMFVAPYIYFVLRNNPLALVEIVLEDETGFNRRNQAALAILNTYWQGRFRCRAATSRAIESSIVPNTVRFIEVPKLKAKYLYIGDIDILVLDNVSRIHLGLMKEHRLPFSNILREGATTSKPRLTGLHFCPFDLYHPLPEISDIDLATANDEHVLYECMRRKGLMVPKSFRVRPECGIHVSLNRDPGGRTTGPNTPVFSAKGGHGWGGRAYYTRFLTQISEEQFLRLSVHFSLEFRLTLLAVEALATDRLRQLHRYAMAYYADRRLLQPNDEFGYRKLLRESKEQLALGDAEGAERAALLAASSWPFNPDVWLRAATVSIRAGKSDRAVECLSHASDLPGGVALICASEIMQGERTMLSTASNWAALERKIAKGPI